MARNWDALRQLQEDGNFDLGVVVSFGHLIPADVIDRFKFVRGPRDRGA